MVWLGRGSTDSTEAGNLRQERGTPSTGTQGPRVANATTTKCQHYKRGDEDVPTGTHYAFPPTSCTIRKAHKEPTSQNAWRQECQGNYRYGDYTPRIAATNPKGNPGSVLYMLECSASPLLMGTRHVMGSVGQRVPLRDRPAHDNGLDSPMHHCRAPGPLRVGAAGIEMRQIHMMALLAAAVLASMVFLFSTPKKYGMILSDVFQKEGRERIVKMNCTSLLDSINPPFPAVLIDLPTLEALKQNQCSTNEHSVRVAVDAQHLNKIRKADFPNYDILYYEKPSCKDYLRFFDKETRIIPRIDFAVYRNFSIPANFKHFTEFWKRSELVDCIGMKVARPPIKSYLPIEKTLRTMSSLMMHLISFDIYPFLNGGSLLVVVFYLMRALCTLLILLVNIEGKIAQLAERS
ncbi:hypothetical protein RB195_011202 [Necator americanus]|uniref:W02B3.4-like N-terminal domain-containing protein n=2 Tax=Necator americanus TaxID=51031 RepID=A0ABR1D4M8_NECAM